MTKICHITTVHPRYDVRIFIKECKSLAKTFCDVNLIVADGKGDETIDGVKKLDEELVKKSFFYDNNILKDTYYKMKEE